MLFLVSSPFFNSRLPIKLGGRLLFCIEFLIMQSLPKLEGSIHHLPEKVYAGDLRRLVLELRNQSEYPVKVWILFFYCPLNSN